MRDNVHDFQQLLLQIYCDSRLTLINVNISGVIVDELENVVCVTIVFLLFFCRCVSKTKTGFEGTVRYERNITLPKR